jgi:hypothetical protein
MNPRFVGEQAGPFEHHLKEKLGAAFTREGVIERAYLTHADLGDRTHNVILALMAPGCDHRIIVDQVERIFTSIFHSSQHLDIAFLDHDDELGLRQICRPFFTRERHDTTQSWPAAMKKARGRSDASTR